MTDKPEDALRYASENKLTVRANNLTVWGFQLTHLDKLPLAVRNRLHDDEDVEWKIQDKNERKK